MLIRRRDRALIGAVLGTALTACGIVAGPAHAAPGTGGAAMPTVIAPSTGGTGYGDPRIRSLVAPPVAVMRKRIVVRGTMPGSPRRRLILQRLDQRRGWRNVARSRVRSTERFAVRWRPDRSGYVKLRAILARNRRSSAAAAAPIVTVRIYRPAWATYYGPGLYGNRTACGQTLTPDLHGVAHKRLRCGTLVAILYEKREIVVPVIDRGPFNGKFSWDLTQATADALGFEGSGRIGYTRAKRR